MRPPRSQQSTARSRAPRLAVLALLFAAAGCSNGAPQQVADGEARGSAPGASPAGATASGDDLASAGAEGSGTPAPSQVEGPGAPTGAGTAGPEGTAEPGSVGLGGDEAAPVAPPAPPAPDIFAVMTGAGFERVHDEDLADYLPVPPRSEGQVGQFRADGQLVRVARVTYPAARFADPHERWLRERIAVLTTRFERVLRVGPTVVHIDADSAELAARAEAAFAPLMPGWDEPGPAGEARP